MKPTQIIELLNKEGEIGPHRKSWVLLGKTRGRLETGQVTPSVSARKRRHTLKPSNWRGFLKETIYKDLKKSYG